MNRRSFPRYVWVVGLAAAVAGCARKAEPVAREEPARSATPAPKVAPKQPRAPAPKKTRTVEATPDRPITLTEGFATPESAFHDPRHDHYLVANINGRPLAADGNGYISKISPDGKMIAARWIDGAREGVTLNAPRGMAVSGALLFVADITYVRWFDRATGEPRGGVLVPGATFVNDIAASPAGAIYATDSGLTKAFKPSGTDAVWIIYPSGSKPVKMTRDKNLGRPNGLGFDRQGRLTVVTMGSGEIFRVDKSGHRVDVVKAPGGGLDGVVHLADGGLLVSSWKARAVFRRDSAGAFTKILEDLESPADIGLDRKRRRLLVPLFKKNRLLIWPLPSQF